MLLGATLVLVAGFVAGYLIAWWQMARRWETTAAVFEERMAALEELVSCEAMARLGPRAAAARGA